MFEGSLYGKGAMVIAVMTYAIAKAQPVKDRMQVTLNPRLLADAIGEDVKDVVKTIEFLCSPDPESTTPGEEGRRLVKIGTFEYWLVNGMKYRAIRDEEERREQVRSAVARHREKMKKKSKPVAGQATYEKMVANGASEEELSAHIERVNQEAIEARKEQRGHPED